MWNIQTTDTWEKDREHYVKKRPSELAAVIRNLDRYMALLEVSKNSMCLQGGYLHKEPMGVIAVDQKGSGPNLQETRLYVYPDDEMKTVYLLKIGGKAAQHSDIECCKRFVISFKRQKEDEKKAKQQ